MYSKVRLSKRQIKEDRFTAFVLRSKQQILENWQFIVIAVVIVALVIAAGVYYVNSQEAHKQESAIRFAEAMMEYRNGNNQVAIASLNQILEEHTGTKAAEHATFLLGKVNFDIRSYSEAIRYWEMYVSKYKTDSLRCSASLAGIAASYENQGSFEQAARKYVEAIAALPNGPMESSYRESAMRSFLAAGLTESAQAQLDTLKLKYEDTDLYNRAARYFSEKARS